MTTRILIVDEFPLLRAGLMSTLAREPGLVVETVTGSASEALACVRTHAPDLAFVGLGFGGNGGLELVSRLRSEAPGMHVLAYALLDERVYAERALRAGARGFLGTRCDAAAVVTAVERVMAGRIYLDDRLQEQLLERLAMPLTAHPVSGGALPGGIDSLTNRELEVFALLGQGLTTLTIAERLHVSVKTVECHRDKIKRKLGLSGSAALIRRAVQWTLQPG